MAPSRKSARQAAGKKKRAGSKRTSAKKRPVRKAASKRGTRSSSRGQKKKTTLKGTARKGLRAAREGIDTVREAGGRTWEVLKSTTSQVVEEFKDRLGQSAEPGGPPRQ